MTQAILDNGGGAFPGGFGAGMMPFSGPAVGRRPIAPSGDLIVGEIREWTAAAAPVLWLLCDGTAVSQVTYAQLFALIGAAFNTGGEPPGTFRVPDLRGRTPAGAGTAVALGASDGLLEAARNPIAHIHPAGGVIDATPVVMGMPLSLGHIWAFPGTGPNSNPGASTPGAGPFAAADGHAHGYSAVWNNHSFPDLNHVHTGGAVNNLANWPAHIGLNFIIHAGA